MEHINDTSSAMTPAGPIRPVRTPWRITRSECEGVYDRHEHWAVIEDLEDGQIIADVEEWVPEETARLMAAAPDLLDACRTVLEDARMALRGAWDRSDSGFRAQIRLLEEVIARAGERDGTSDDLS